MMYYKSIRHIDGKTVWTIEDENGNINRNPTKEQLDKTEIDSPRRIYRKRKCYICGANDTYIFRPKRNKAQKSAYM